MLKFIARRLLSLVIILLVLTFLLFLMQTYSPIDPVRAILGEKANAAALAALRAKMGLDDPLYVQYFHYLGGLLHGDLGVSYRSRQPVIDDLKAFVPATLELGIAGMVIAVILGVIFALTTLSRSKPLALFRGFILTGAAAPTFLLGVLGVILFYKTLGWLPASGRSSESGHGPTRFLLIDDILAGNITGFFDAIHHLILPALCIAIGPSLVIGRVFASSLRSTLDYDYVRTAQAKGLTGSQVVGRHVIRNASSPVLSLVGLQIGAMFAGALVVENIFSWPGLGLYMSGAIGASDFPAISAITLILGAGYILVNAAVDILQGVIDPRLRVA
ncbi:ABC transporter permease [Glaciihabitans sp. dw_435]|uniref:ABC transporter permease n=1 Tax=Glaciihabitans sp. dw_435 TaxID=2720081 RepID=UPI001BD5930F|nr:ABC transporter permease [Glaciihabitans sp. dw_435]